MPSRPPLLILGMHRSGTSALSRAMNLCGWRLAERIMPPSPGNPAGYWEPIEIVKFNDRMLRAIDHHWADPSPMPEGWADRPEIVALEDEAAAIIEADFPDPGGALLKDPRLSRLFPFWQRVFARFGAEPACVLMSRHPLEVADSLARRENMDRRHALLLWLAYMLDAEADSRSSRRAVIDFDALLADWRASLAPAVDAVWPNGDAAFDERADELDTFLDPDHRHFTGALDDFSAAGDLADAIGRALDWFGKADRDPEDLDAVRAGWRDWWSRPEAQADRRAMMRKLPSLHFEAATALRAEGAFDKALEAIDRAVAAVPGATHYRARRGEILGDLGRHEEAIDTFLGALEIGGPNPNQLRNLCRQYLALGREAEAIDTMRGALGQAGGMPFIAAQLAKELEEEGRHAAAAGLFAVAVEGAPERHPLHASHSRALEHAGRREAAIAAINRALELAPRKPRYRKQLERLQAAREGSKS